MAITGWKMKVTIFNINGLVMNVSLVFVRHAVMISFVVNTPPFFQTIQHVVPIGEDRQGCDEDRPKPRRHHKKSAKRRSRSSSSVDEAERQQQLERRHRNLKAKPNRNVSSENIYNVPMDAPAGSESTDSNHEVSSHCSSPMSTLSPNGRHQSMPKPPPQFSSFSSSPDDSVADQSNIMESSHIYMEVQNKRWMFAVV